MEHGLDGNRSPPLRRLSEGVLEQIDSGPEIPGPLQGIRLLPRFRPVLLFLTGKYGGLILVFALIIHSGRWIRAPAALATRDGRAPTDQPGAGHFGNVPHC